MSDSVVVPDAPAWPVTTGLDSLPTPVAKVIEAPEAVPKPRGQQRARAVARKRAPAELEDEDGRP